MARLVLKTTRPVAACKEKKERTYTHSLDMVAATDSLLLVSTMSFTPPVDH